MISEATINKIFSTIKIEDIVGEYVQLKRAGSNLKGLSPFHEEKTPSFIVSPSKQIWKDFSSGKGGSAISFLMEIEGFTYPEALKYAAKKYSIEIEEDLSQYSDEDKKAEEEKEQILKVHEVATTFFQDQLKTPEGLANGAAYFKERELTSFIISKFQLGYSPEQKNAFTQYALDKGYSRNILEKSGLSVFKTEPADRFRGRVIFPIQNFTGRVVGFGGRILTDAKDTAKYLNSPETPIYNKSNILYGLYLSKQAISRQDHALLVEGYMDVIALHQAGIENVVSASGTALTAEHIKLIKRLTDNVTILFDGDSAGIKASFRSIDMLLSESMNIRVLLFPDGHDPDSFSRGRPKEEIEQFISKWANDFIEFKADVLLEEAGDDPIKKSSAITSVVKSVGNVPNAIKQEVYIQKISKRFKISESALFNELKAMEQKILEVKNRYTKDRVEPQEIKPIVNPLLILEEMLIHLLLKYGGKYIEYQHDGDLYRLTVIEEIVGSIEEDTMKLTDPINQKIYEIIKEGMKIKEYRTIDYFMALNDEEILFKISDLFIKPYSYAGWETFHVFIPDIELTKVVQDTLYRFKKEYILVVIDFLLKELSEENEEDIYRKIRDLYILRSQLNIELHAKS